MPDIAMCMNKDCSKSKDCYRFRAEPSPYRQTYMVIPEEKIKDCKHFWQIEKGMRLNNKGAGNYKRVGERK